MANTKITELTQLTNPVSTDVLPIVDVGADVTKKISIADLLKNASTGTADAPGIAFDGRSRNGIYSPGADQVAISTNGTGRLFVDSSGRVGIGTTPSTALHLGGSSAQTIRINSATSAAFFGATGYITQIAANRNPVDGSIVNTGTATCFINLEAEVGNGNIQFCTTATNNASPTERMRLDSSGRLALGTSAPTYTLDVVGFGQQSIRVASADGDLAILRMLSNGNNEWSLASDTVMRFRKDSTEYMRLDSSGRLGIGTGSPGTTLEVNGTISQTSQGTSSALYWAVNSGGTFYYGIDNSVGGSFGEAYAAALWHSGNRPMLFATSNSEKMRLNASGRLGLGTSDPEAALDVRGAIQGGNGTIKGQISYSTRVEMGAASNHNLGFITNSTTQMLLDTSGRLGIGVTEPNYTLDVSATGSTISSAFRTDQSESWVALQDSGTTIGHVRLGSASGAMLFYAGNGERGKFDSSGRFDLWGGSTVNTINCVTPVAAGTTYYLIYGGHSSSGAGNVGTQSFGVWSNGNVINTNNSYGAISDLKLKENIVDSTSQWDDIKALQIRKYNFKEGQTHTQIGLIAQEVELVSPGLVTESPDRDKDGNDLGTVTKSVNYSVLYMKAVKALQEAMERIEALEAKVAALEAQ